MTQSTRLGSTKIIISGHDQTSAVRVDRIPIVINNLLNEQVDTCIFHIQDANSVINVWNEVRIFANGSQNGLHASTNIIIGDPGIGDNNTSVFYQDTSTGNATNLYTAELATKFINKGTIALWLKFDASAYDNTDRYVFYIKSNTNVFTLMLDSSTQNLLCYKNAGETKVITLDTTQSTSWQHILITWDETSGSFIGYQNGVNVSNETTTNPLGTIDTFLIGARESGFNSSLANIAHVAIWDNALIGSEITLLYENLSTYFNGVFDTKPILSLIGYWPFFETSQNLIAHEYADKTKVFGGNIQHIDRKFDGGDEVFSITCSDFSALLMNPYVKKEYEDTSDFDIIEDLISDPVNNLSDLDTSLVEEVVTHTQIRFNRVDVFSVISELSSLANGNWYVDYNKQIRFFATSSIQAPFDLSTDPDFITSYPIADINITTDATKIVNRVEVVGGTFLSEDLTLFVSGTGQDNRIILPFRLSAPTTASSVVIERNDGTEGSPSWTLLTTKAGYIDQLINPNDVLYYYQEQVIEQANPWPALNNAVRLTGRQSVPLRTQIKDDSSYNIYNRWFDAIISDSDIIDKNTARLAALALIAERGLANPAINVTTWRYGLRAGQTLHITHDALGIDDDFVIQRVRTTISTGGNTTTDIAAGIYNPDIVDMMVKLARDTRDKPLWRDDEVLDQANRFEETMQLTDTTDVTSTQAPYTWGVSGVNDFNWGFGKWS